MVTRILLIRHAATEAAGRLCGSFDLPLSPAGRGQIAALLERLGGQRAVAAPAALYTSPLRRAAEVAAALAHTWALEAHPAKWAREIHCGDVEGMSLDRVRRDFPDHWARNEAQLDETFAWPGGETYADFRRRILNGLNLIASTYPGERVAVVTHSGVISQVLGVIRGRPASVWAPDRPDPLTATEITWQNDAPRAVLSYNERSWY